MKKLLLIALLLISTTLSGQKSLYFYSDINNPSASNAMRSLVQASGVPFTELMLGRDLRRHSVNRGGIEVLIDIDGRVYQELQPSTSGEISSAFTSAPTTFPAPTAPAINPLITKAQAQTALKNLLETNPSAWTQLMRDQAMYLLLLFASRDLQNGTVY